MPILDLSYLPPEERTELAEQLWDSIDSEAVQPADEQVAELRRPGAELTADEDPGEAGDQVLKVAERGE